MRLPKEEVAATASAAAGVASALEVQEPEDPPAPAPAAPPKTSPAVRKLAAEQGVDLQDVASTGKRGRVTREDVKAHIESAQGEPVQAPPDTPQSRAAPEGQEDRGIRRVPMTALRRSIAKRLVASQHQSAMLTTFNEVNMTNIMDLRKRYKESFEKSHGVKLGFMSFFIKAVIDALKAYPVINASVDGDDIVYHDYFDIGVAVSTERGLIVPVVRDAGRLSFSEIEGRIVDFASRARENRITIEELTGGTFTITNGGVFGSMMSTPIINPPQSAILGMHAITESAVVPRGESASAPIDVPGAELRTIVLLTGKEAVQFLNQAKNTIEDPCDFYCRPDRHIHHAAI